MRFAQHLLSSSARAPRHNVVALGQRPRSRAAGVHPRAAAAGARPLRLIVDRRDDGAVRLVISGRMADVCAELNRLALT